jgi:hypothetical protein
VSGAQIVHECLPQVREYLALPPGYRFLIDGTGYEDLWSDSSRLDT